jgi:hypothetical protein
VVASVHAPLVQRWPVEQALHTPPPVPQLVVLIPLWQLPLESTHPLQDWLPASVAVPVHAPLVQRWPVEHALHTPPPVPQLVVLIPLWQFPLESVHAHDVPASLRPVRPAVPVFLVDVVDLLPPLPPSLTTPVRPPAEKLPPPFGITISPPEPAPLVSLSSSSPPQLSTAVPNTKVVPSTMLALTSLLLNVISLSISSAPSREFEAR